MERRLASGLSQTSRNVSLASLFDYYPALFTLLSIVETKGTFINGEFSWGRWNGDDVKALEEPLKILQARISM